MDMRWKDTSLSFEERAENLVAQMTLEEKISQMTYAASALSRFGIPEYNWWNESLHGVARAGTATVFPQAIGMAASFDDVRMRAVADIIADEGRAKHHAAAAMEDRDIYKGLDMWSPNINLFRDPRWGRGHETYGEDPYLTGRIGAAFIRGLQGDDPKYYKLIATAKHYAVHSGPEASRHSFDAVASRRDMVETYLPAFETAVKEAGVYSVMGAYNRVNGEPACGSETLLERILRGEWGFSGYVVSDCGAIEDFYQHHKVAADEAESAALAVNNGCDLCCGWIFPHLKEAVARGLVAEETITRAATRLMLARLKLGMFDPEEQVPYAAIPYDVIDCAQHHAASLDMAQASLTLLKNEGILPLDASTIRRIAVIGPNADSREALMGNYAGTPSQTVTVLEGIRRLAQGARVDYAQGCALTGGSKEEPWGEAGTFRLSEAMNAAQRADVVILCLGLNGEIEGEQGDATGDRATLDLPQSQILLADALAGLGKPIVLVNMTGSACVYPREEGMGAILQAWYPGQFGGLAVANALFGKVSPGGRLPVTFYKNTEQLPPFEDYSMEGRTYRFMREEPNYPFGFGLSYTKFAYGGLKVPARIGAGEALRVSVTVRNVGGVAGEEVAQLYIRHADAKTRVPNHQLVGFARVALQPGESREVAFTVEPKWLSVVDEAGERGQFPGTLEVFAGGQQPDSRSETLTGVKPLTERVEVS